MTAFWGLTVHDRDPRIEPTSGDLVGTGDDARWVVRCYHDGERQQVVYRLGGEQVPRTCSLATWRRWARKRAWRASFDCLCCGQPLPYPVVGPEQHLFAVGLYKLSEGLRLQASGAHDPWSEARLNEVVDYLMCRLERWRPSTGAFDDLVRQLVEQAIADARERDPRVGVVLAQRAEVMGARGVHGTTA